MIKSLKKIKSKISRDYSLYKCKKNQDGKTIWLSLGENCLPDDVLRRFYLKSYSSLFASGRSNIDYILNMHENDYNGLLDRKHVVYGKIGDENVLRSSIYNTCERFYHEMHLNGFEFTHHDWLKKPELKHTLERRIMRMKSEIGKFDISFLYLHRISENSNIEEIKSRLLKLSKLFSKDGHKCTVIFFYQKIVSNKKERKLVIRSEELPILEYELHTLNLWEGNNQRIFWGKKDNDLLKKMLKNAKKKLCIKK
ncbi:DUF1796 family putative cysteine peptidase [Klebsiella pneumoniae]|uniref:DUF1796 family putative cysteine peptidase n=2 Tax=Klebsiella pneumoniae TaxID=573 RepID=UPI0008028B7C|nr:DUF1796 family putative cysteine peptidase [Klebsiella pneumoniae]EKZ5818410.1 hypothetical protein [Klebsiella pneumoniae]EMA4559445.1 hypothetical protein [Klebsiella pneumoniae]EMB2195329.1 hypothetical protein [Klebsiella pneumoniae]MBL0838690.1 hypothetical protein [Klebsiella pneumoniae]MCQ6408322.1 papain-like cysteine peptidase [Klebsiella pneumoniae]